MHDFAGSSYILFGEKGSIEGYGMAIAKMENKGERLENVFTHMRRLPPGRVVTLTKLKEINKERKKEKEREIGVSQNRTFYFELEEKKTHRRL